MGVAGWNLSWEFLNLPFCNRALLGSVSTRPCRREHLLLSKVKPTSYFMNLESMARWWFFQILNLDLRTQSSQHFPTSQQFPQLLTITQLHCWWEFTYQQLMYNWWYVVSQSRSGTNHLTPFLHCSHRVLLTSNRWGTILFQSLISYKWNGMVPAGILITNTGIYRQQQSG